MSAEEKEVECRDVPLPSGKKASIRRGKGRDLVLASRMAGGGTDTIRLTYGIIAVLTRIDGKPITIEDVDEMDLPDVMKLMGEVVGNGGSSLNSISSSFGSTGDSPTVN